MQGDYFNILAVSKKTNKIRAAICLLPGQEGDANE